MKSLIKMLLLTLIINSSFVFGQSQTEAKNTYADIKQNLGIVPDFLKNYPESAITGAWEDMKAIQLNNKTALSGKQKELIGLAVAAQIPCHYCIYFHTQAAKLNGASPQEISETLAMAGSVRRWSTVLHGNQIKEEDFRTEVDRMIEIAQQKKSTQAMEEKQTTAAPELKTAEDAYKDIELNIGFVPGFFKAYPQEGIVGAWKEMKNLEMNPKTALSAKDKELIGLSVAAQVPCPYCIYYHTKLAQFQGASTQEVQEAVAMAAITRNWSTILNGQYTDSKKFELQTDQIMKFLKTKASKKVTSAQ